MKLEALPGHIEEAEGPMVLAAELGFWLSDFLREGTVTLFEAYLLNGERLRLERWSYTRPAFGSQSRYSQTLALLMQTLLSEVWNEPRAAAHYRSWLRGALEALGETRPHYSQAISAEVAAGEIHTSTLQALEPAQAP
jgi:hypothetical protein